MNGESDRPEADEADAVASEVAAEQSPDDAMPESQEPATESELLARVDENWEKYLRTAAELENVRKRAARDVENAHKFALERFVNELLAVRDSLEMGLAAGEDADVESLRKGKEATLLLLTTVMERFGVAEVDPQGEPFDPALHEAMTMQPSADVEPGSVLSVFQKGYTLNGRLLRPAKVVVAAELEDNAGKG
jgi:molecular chaperone GrpE